MKRLSIDFGASTVDVVRWSDGQLEDAVSYERDQVDVSSLEAFLTDQAIDLDGIEEIRVTGGKTHSCEAAVNDILVQRVDEIEAIGKGGQWLFDGKDGLVVSLGTGTCMVAARGGDYAHVGGTGVGGGTFMGLCKMMLEETDPERLAGLFQSGDSKKVDLSVEEAIGRDIGKVPAEMTASNLGKIVRAGEIDFEKADLAAGIVKLVGQTIATAAVFASRSEELDTIILTGKLTRMQQVLDIIFEVGELYERKIVLPDKAEFVSAIGAGL